MKQYPNVFKFCVTCAYWTGCRTTDNFGTYVKVESDNVTGKCMAPMGKGWRGQDRRTNAYCSAYKKWEVLR
ncbi:MAG: hypothetical protein IKD47_04455 [Clostridia bacterium]|nr:hypothetical protein [Clostridia bacterium]